MASNFKVGSISDIVNTPSKKKLNKKLKSPKLQPSQDETVITEEPQSDLKVASKKRKVSESEHVTVEVSQTISPAQKKGKRARKASATEEVTTVEASVEESPVRMEQNKKQSSKAQKSKDGKSDVEKLSRTLFIGNLPSGFVLKDLKKNLSEYGSIISIRVRGVAPAKETLSKKVAFLS